MNLSGIISISGRPGLYKVITQSKNSIIVESLVDKKRTPAYSTDRISALEDISIYTYDDDKPLKDILGDIYAKQNGEAAPSHKEDLSTLQEFLTDILPDYDEERVYASDIKKIFQWYNMLLKSGNLKPTEPETTAEQEEKPKAEKKATKSADETPAASTAKKKAAPKSENGKASEIKKKAAPKKQVTKD